MHSNRALQISFASLAFTLSTAAIAATGARSAQAGPLPCAQVEQQLATHGEAIRARLSAEVGGRQHKLGPLKTLVINGVSAVETGGNCDITVTLDVKLKRKIRRDASGKLKIGAHVDVTVPDDHSVDITFDNLHITDVKLAHTMELGENVYKFVANLVMPKSQTLHVAL